MNQSKLKIEQEDAKIAKEEAEKGVEEEAYIVEKNTEKEKVGVDEEFFDVNSSDGEPH